VSSGRSRSVGRKLALFPVVLAGFLLSACGSFFVGFVSNPQIPTSTVTGRVSVVILVSVNDTNGNPLTVTAVTFVNGGLASTSNFCGDQRSQFPMNSTVQASFTKTPDCLSLVNVIVVSGASP
jgi:hypothetical protein